VIVTRIVENGRSGGLGHLDHLVIDQDRRTFGGGLGGCPIRMGACSDAIVSALERLRKYCASQYDLLQCNNFVLTQE
jgi:hypothetical protein